MEEKEIKKNAGEQKTKNIAKSNKEQKKPAQKKEVKKADNFAKQGAQKATPKNQAKSASKKSAVAQDKKTEESVVVEESQSKSKASSNKKVKITFLGGVGEIGKNMTAIEYDNEMIVVDAGLTFPGDDLPGIDLVVPDISYLVANKSKIKAICLTHGHEDHIGGLPYLLNEINAPVYGSRLTLGLVENKMHEHSKIKYKAVSVKPRNVLKLGKMSVEFIKVSHSIAGSLALCINTPVGNIIHTGDFKIDFEPIDGSMTDLIRFGELGKKGVSLLLCESTNVCRQGYSMSESKVGKTLNELFDKNKSKRIFVATFASNIHRMQQILDIAEAHKRKVAFSGRSMLAISETAMKLGELRFNRENVIDIDKIDKFPDNELVIVTTGSQGEPMSALRRMSNDNFPKVRIGDNDTIIFSSSPIPGNEKSVYNVINALFKKGADVIYDELADVHVSGHACQEELKTMHALVNPKFFMPIHGEYRHLKRHEQLAMDMGMHQSEIILPDLGMQVELGENYIKRCGTVTAGQRLIDGSGVGDMGSSVLRDRLQLSEEGMCVVALDIKRDGLTFDCEPCIITRGLVYDEEAEQLIADAKAHILATIAESDFFNLEINEMKNAVKKMVSSFIFKRTKRRPMVFALIFMDEVKD